MLPERLPPCSCAGAGAGPVAAGDTPEIVDDDAWAAATAGYEINCCCCGNDVDLMAPPLANEGAVAAPTAAA